MATAPRPSSARARPNASGDALDAATAEATRRVYAGAWTRFVDWCDRQDVECLPAHPVSVATYLADRADAGLSPSSIRLDRAAIRAYHLENGHRSPTDHPGVKRAALGIVHTAASERGNPRQAAALTSDALAAIRATAHLPRRGPAGRTESPETARVRGAVDVAICAVMRDAMLRRSEAAALRWVDVQLEPDGTGRVTIRTSKTDQTGEGVVLYVGVVAARALAAIRPDDVDPEARVFRLSGRQISRRISSAATSARLAGAFSGPLRPGWHGARPSGRRCLGRGRAGGRPLDVRPDASPLRTRGAGGSGSRGQLLQGRRVAARGGSARQPRLDVVKAQSPAARRPPFSRVEVEKIFHGHKLVAFGRVTARSLHQRVAPFFRELP